MESTFGIDRADIISISAKTGKGVDAVLEAIVERIPPPSGKTSGPVKAFLFDSLYDKYRGVISLVAVKDGILKKGQRIQAACCFVALILPAGDRIASCHTRKKYEITDIGIMHPEEVPVNALHPGQVGFIACNMKESSEGIEVLRTM